MSNCGRCSKELTGLSVDARCAWCKKSVNVCTECYSSPGVHDLFMTGYYTTSCHMCNHHFHYMNNEDPPYETKNKKEAEEFERNMNKKCRECKINLRSSGCSLRCDALECRLKCSVCKIRPRCIDKMRCDSATCLRPCLVCHKNEWINKETRKCGNPDCA